MVYYQAMGFSLVRIRLFALLTVAATAVAAMVPFASVAGVVVTAAGLAGDGTEPCADAIQRLIDSNPNREIFFPDGTYLLDKPICTPAHPQKSVALRLSAFAKFKAAPGWTNTEAMVRLGAIHPANNIWLAGSWYWLKGGIIDGSGVAKGVSIDGGRETLVADVSMKNVLVGLHVKRGANNGSADSDVRNVNIVGNNAPGSIGVLVDGYDTTFANMRIYAVARGMVINGGGCSCRDIHPLLAMKGRDFYAKSIGFEINAGAVWMDFCYSDQFATGFRFGPRGGGVLDKCFCFWYKSTPDMRHVAFSSAEKFNAKIKSPVVSFTNAAATNCLLEAGAPDGKGYIQDADCNLGRVNDPRDVHGKYLRD